MEKKERTAEKDMPKVHEFRVGFWSVFLYGLGCSILGIIFYMLLTTYVF